MPAQETVCQRQESNAKHDFRIPHRSLLEVTKEIHGHHYIGLPALIYSSLYNVEKTLESLEFINIYIYMFLMYVCIYMCIRISELTLKERHAKFIRSSRMLRYYNKPAIGAFILIRAEIVLRYFLRPQIKCTKHYVSISYRFKAHSSAELKNKVFTSIQTRT
jgi:hypothetical protein